LELVLYLSGSAGWRNSVTTLELLGRHVDHECKSGIDVSNYGAGIKLFELVEVEQLVFLFAIEDFEHLVCGVVVEDPV